MCPLAIVIGVIGVILQRSSDFVYTSVCGSFFLGLLGLVSPAHLYLFGFLLFPGPLAYDPDGFTPHQLGTTSVTKHRMPSLVVPNSNPEFMQSGSGVTKFTNCLLVRGNDLVNEDLWVSSISGKILNGQEMLFDHRIAPDQVVDLGGRILSPGFIETQMNGAYGFDFSVIPNEGTAAYGKGVLRVNRSLVATGVTSYLPTLTSQRPEVYQEVSRKVSDYLALC